MAKYLLYWDWVAVEAKLINSDGCSDAIEAYHKCCLQHDLSYRYAADPVDAYKHYIAGNPDYWGIAKPITKSKADATFRKCIQSNSKLGKFSPMAGWRWLALKLFGQKAWNSHRQQEHN